MLVVAAPSTALAVEDDPNQAITFDPAFLHVRADPGETVQVDLVIKNQTLADAAFDLATLDMQAGAGRSEAFDYVASGDAPRGAGDWLRLDADTFTLDAGTERRVRVTVVVPGDPGAGGHFAAISATISSPNPAAQFDVDYEAPVPVFITVSGAFERDLRVAIKPDDDFRWRGGTATWTVTMHNEGDVHEVVNARVRLNSGISGSTSTPIRPAILLPGERREQEVAFQLRSAPDVWHAEAIAERDEAGAVTVRSARTVVLPWWLLVLLAVAFVVVWVRVRARRSHAHEQIDDDDLDDVHGFS